MLSTILSWSNVYLSTNLDREQQSRYADDNGGDAKDCAQDEEHR